MVPAAKTLRVDLVDVLGPGGAGREPPVLGHHLDAADRRAVAGRGGEDGLDGGAGQAAGPDVARRERRQPGLLGRGRGRIDTRVDGVAEVPGEFAG